MLRCSVDELRSEKIGDEGPVNVGSAFPTRLGRRAASSPEVFRAKGCCSSRRPRGENRVLQSWTGSSEAMSPTMISTSVKGRNRVAHTGIDVERYAGVEDLDAVAHASCCSRS